MVSTEKATTSKDFTAIKPQTDLESRIRLFRRRNQIEAPETYRATFSQSVQPDFDGRYRPAPDIGYQDKSYQDQTSQMDSKDKYRPDSTGGYDQQIFPILRDVLQKIVEFLPKLLQNYGNQNPAPYGQPPAPIPMPAPYTPPPSPYATTGVAGTAGTAGTTGTAGTAGTAGIAGTAGTAGGALQAGGLQNVMQLMFQLLSVFLGLFSQGGLGQAGTAGIAGTAGSTRSTASLLPNPLLR